MKKIALILVPILMLASSCIQSGSTFQANYTFTDTGNYDNAESLFENGETVYLFKALQGSTTGESAFVVGNVIAYFGKGTSSLTGGFALSRRAWKEASSEDGSADLTTPEEYSVYGENPTTSQNTFFYYRQSYGSNMPEHDIAFAAADIGTCAPASVSVSNAASTVRAIRGDNVDMNTFNLQGNITLTAIGYLDGEETGRADFLLAGKGKGKITEVNPQGDSLVTSWKKFELTDLGSIDYIDFEISLSNAADESLFYNGYKDVCLDNFSADINISY